MATLTVEHRLQACGLQFHAGSVVMAHGPSCSAAHGLFPDRNRTLVSCAGRGTLPCHQGSPTNLIWGVLKLEFRDWWTFTGVNDICDIVCTSRCWYSKHLFYFCLFPLQSKLVNPLKNFTDFLMHQFIIHLFGKEGFPDSSVGKESACNAGDPGSIPGQEDPLEKG